MTDELVEKVRNAVHTYDDDETLRAIIEVVERAVTPAIEARVTGEIVAWLRADADKTEQEATRIVADTTGDARKNAADWAMLVSLKRGLADAIERGDHKESQP